MNEFGTLENLIVNAEKITKTSVRQSIISSAERLRNNYRMIRLDGQVELPFQLNELTYVYSGMTTNEVLQEIGLK